LAERRRLPNLRRGSLLDDFIDAKCVVIPKLEWFCDRDHTQLGPLLELSEYLTRLEGEVIVGCSSWALQLLKQFDDALLLFDDAKSVPVFDANVPAAILKQAFPKTSDRAKFVSVQSGETVLLRDDDTLCDPCLQNVAGHSLGLLWIKIRIFFCGIAETKNTEDASSGSQIWVDLPTPCSLPVSCAAQKSLYRCP
jgi:hypothetical protein